GIIAKTVGGRCAGPASPFPLRFRGQPVLLASLLREPAAILHGRVMRDRQHGELLAAVAERLVGVRWRRAGDGVADLVQLFSDVRPRRRPSGTLRPKVIVLVPGHFTFPYPERLNAYRVLRPFVGPPPAFTCG